MWSSECNGCPSAKSKLMGTKMLVTIHISSNNIPDILKLESNNSLFTKIEKKDSKISIF